MIISNEVRSRRSRAFRLLDSMMAVFQQYAISIDFANLGVDVGEMAAGQPANDRFPGRTNRGPDFLLPSCKLGIIKFRVGPAFLSVFCVPYDDGFWGDRCEIGNTCSHGTNIIDFSDLDVLIELLTQLVGSAI